MPMTPILKGVILAIAYLIAFILLLPLLILRLIRFMQFDTVSHLLSIIPGAGGVILRRVWYKLMLKSCGDNLNVDFMGAIRSANTEIGSNVYIGLGTWIGNAIIGDDCMVSGYVLIMSGGAQHGVSRLDIPMRLQKGVVKQVHIGKDVWVGAGAVIFSDVADHTVIGAGSVVTKKFAPYDVIAGVPAKKIK